MNSENTTSDKPIQKPIYPPDLGKAVLYWTSSFLTFVVAAAYLIFSLTVLTGIVLATASAYAGEQLYKKNVWKEILYYRALGSAIDEEE